MSIYQTLPVTSIPHLPCPANTKVFDQFVGLPQFGAFPAALSGMQGPCSHNVAPFLFDISNYMARIPIFEFLGDPPDFIGFSFIKDIHYP